jgi:hypothetical protein
MIHIAKDKHIIAIHKITESCWHVSSNREDEPLFVFDNESDAMDKLQELLG